MKSVLTQLSNHKNIVTHLSDHKNVVLQLSNHAKVVQGAIELISRSHQV